MHWPLWCSLLLLFLFLLLVLVVVARCVPVWLALSSGWLLQSAASQWPARLSTVVNVVAT